MSQLDAYKYLSWRPYMRRERGEVIPIIACDYKVRGITLMQSISKHGWGYQNKGAFLRKAVPCELTPAHRELLPRLPGGLPTASAVGCERCDTFGGEKTYANQACLPIGGRIVCVDWCIHHIVAALNAAGVATVASCCGHRQTDGRIDLADGRVLIVKSKEAA